MLNIVNQKSPNQDQNYELRFNIQRNEVLPYNYTLIKKFKNKNILTKKEVESLFIKDLEFLKNYTIYYNFKNFNNLTLDEELPNNYSIDVLARNQILNIVGNQTTISSTLISLVVMFLLILFLAFFYFFNHYINFNRESNVFILLSSMNAVFYISFFILSLVLYYLKFLDVKIVLSGSYYIKGFIQILLLRSYFNENHKNYIMYDFLAKFIYSLFIMISGLIINIFYKKNNTIIINNIYSLCVALISINYLDFDDIYFENKIIKRPYDIISLFINIFGLFGILFYQYNDSNLYIFSIILNNIFHIGILTTTITQYNNTNILVNLEFLNVLSNLITFALILFYFYRNVELLPKLLSLKKVVLTKKIDFIGYLVHELKTPLMNIKTKTGMILDSKEMEREILDDNMKSILRSSNTLKSLIEDFLMFSKSKISNVKLRIQKCDVEEIKTEINRTIENLNPEFSIQYETNIDIFYADRIKVIQVLINFITNAIKYCQKSEITLCIKRDILGYLYVSVRDNGVGISYSRLYNLVLPFSRQRDNMHEIKRKGDGLGLYISKEFINYMDGIFYIKTAENKGSEFAFYIPIYSEPESKEVLIIDVEEKNKRILIYDDDKIMRDIYEIFLKKFNITIASNEDELIEYIKNNEYDLLIIDYYLQGMTGLDIINILKKVDIKNNRKTKTLVVSGYDDLLLVKSKLIDDILGKPFEKNNLLEKIIKLIYNK